MQPPAYFEAVRRDAAESWDLLEARLDLAGPWHQLFKQVQSPRHVLSELLQNADDAGAREASVRIENGVFEFEHDGDDFSREQFESLCCFGYSNKRSLHTIGFRGVGFKSTFSLGDPVQVITPSLAVRFERRRFTQPVWSPPDAVEGPLTRIRVEIADDRRKEEVERNLQEWLEAPLSLLFFRNIRRIRIGEREVHWGSLGPGSAPRSEWWALHDDPDTAFLLLRSEAESFPEEALAEVREERLLAAEEAAELPPCTIEIVLEAKGRLYVVLPTGVETQLPFACNAPFIQDPARIAIKDPRMSATNRWLLERAGRLAAAAMMQWLNHGDAATVDRADAYRLLPDVDRDDTSLEGTCGTIVEEAFEEVIDGKDLLLTEDGRLLPAGRTVALPGPILDVWPADQAAALLDDEGRPPLSHHVVVGDRKKLIRWRLLAEVDKQQLFSILEQRHLPRPESWQQLLNLWAFLAPEITGYRYNVQSEALRIVPAQGKDVLYAANEVVRLGERRLLQSDDDWEFLGKYLVVLNQNWPRFLADRRRVSSDDGENPVREATEAAFAVLKRIGLEDSSNLNKIVEQVTDEFFSDVEVGLSDAVRISQIVAKLNASVPNGFCYVMRDLGVRAIDRGVLFDEDGRLEALLPPEDHEMHLIHTRYFTFESCSRDEWVAWVRSGKSGLLTFPQIREEESRYSSRDSFLRALAGATGYRETPAFPYASGRVYPNQWYYLADFDFDPALVEHWNTAAAEPSPWVTLTELLLSSPPKTWQSTVNVSARQTRTDGQSKRSVPLPALPSAWLRRLASVECLPDTRGVPRRPEDLLRRTPATEPFMDVEPFVHGSLDTEATLELLDLLGVRTSPTGPDRLLDCLRTLAESEDPPVREVEKWYHRLDQMLETCSTPELVKVKSVFRSERLILAHDGAWTTTSGVFLSPDDDGAPGAPLIRASVSDLSLWGRLGVAERPTADLAIRWLKSLPTGAPLSTGDARRVRALLMRHPGRIWDECGCWLNLAGEWVPVDSLSYAITMQSLTPWRHLHPWVKQRTADFHGLPTEVTQDLPFSELPLLSAHVEERFEDSLSPSGAPLKGEWLRTLAAELQRVQIDDDEEETTRVRGLAASLLETGWLEVPGLRIVPYIDGTPAGTPRKADAVWLGNTLYVDQLPKAKLARGVPEEIGRAFRRADIKAALDYSFDRSASDIQAYLGANFTLVTVDVGVLSKPAGDGDKVVAPRPPVGHAPAQDSDGEPPPPEAEGTLEDTDDVHDLEQAVARGAGMRPDTPKRTKPPGPSLIERFAKIRGFRKDGEERFFHADGSWIGRVKGEPFPWVHHSASGDRLRAYWPKEHCLEHEPLQVDAAIWGHLNRYSGAYAVILTDPDGAPIELTGEEICAMAERGAIRLFPASYRLVYEHDA